MLNALYNWIAKKSPAFLLLRAHDEAECRWTTMQRDRILRLEADIQGRETERKHLLAEFEAAVAKFEAKKLQCQELQRALSSMQGARDHIKEHDDFLKRQLDEAYKHINRLTGEQAETEENYRLFRERAKAYRESVKEKVKESLFPRTGESTP